jgi:hypothetical protein
MYGQWESPPVGVKVLLTRSQQSLIASLISGRMGSSFPFHASDMESAIAMRNPGQSSWEAIFRDLSIENILTFDLLSIF